MNNSRLVRLFCMMANINLYIYGPCLGNYYIVDAGYPNRPGYLAPYKDERYHMPEWHRDMETKTPKEKSIAFTLLFEMLLRDLLEF